MGNKFELVTNYTGDPVLPKRATKGSAGYDVFAPYDVSVYPNETEIVCTGIKAHIKQGEFLMLAPRSSLGITYDVTLANTIGIIDQDYYNNPTNEGEICVALKNLGGAPIFFEPGDKIAQLIFVRYDTTDDDDTDGTRIGGIGSTDSPSLTEAILKRKAETRYA